MIKDLLLLKRELIYNKRSAFSADVFLGDSLKFFYAAYTLAYFPWLITDRYAPIYKDDSDLDFEVPKDPLEIQNFSSKSFISLFREGYDVVLIVKTGKNLFVKWFDCLGRLRLSKSIMTLEDPQKLKTKKQKSFSVYFLLRKFARKLQKNYYLKNVSLLLKGSLGIRRKKTFLSGLTHSGLIVSSILDITNVPFNGCRLKKKKRK